MAGRFDSVKWVPDADAADCNACKAKFTVIRRRHHCRACGGVFCGTCSSKTRRIPRLGLKDEVRVCDRCYDKEAPPKPINIRAAATDSAVPAASQPSSAPANSSSGMAYCEYCGFAQESATFRFCTECGSARVDKAANTVNCRICGTEQSPSNNFCEQCGFVIHPDKKVPKQLRGAVQARASISGSRGHSHRRQVSVLPALGGSDDNSSFNFTVKRKEISSEEKQARELERKELLSLFSSFKKSGPPKGAALPRPKAGAPLPRPKAGAPLPRPKAGNNVSSAAAAERRKQAVAKQREAAERAKQQREAAERAKQQREAAERAKQQREAAERARQEKEAAERARRQREAAERARREKAEAEERLRLQKEREEREKERARAAAEAKAAQLRLKRLQEEEEARIKQQKLKKEEEEKALAAAREAAAKKRREEEEKRKREKDERRRREAAQAAQAKKRREEEERQRRKREEEEEARRKEEAERKRRQEAERQRKRREEEEKERQKKKKREEELRRKQKEEEEQKRKQQQQQQQKAQAKKTPKPSGAAAPPAKSAGWAASRGAAFTSAVDDKAKAVEAKARKRIDDAIRWVDKEIRKLIKAIEDLSEQQSDPMTVTFGDLFDATTQIFEALSGTLMTAKKRKVVQYDGQLLLQRVHDDVVITLLKHSIEDTPLPDHDKIRSKRPQKASPFAVIDNSKPVVCDSCGKRVYPAERVGAGKKVFHKKCFKCFTCNRTLTPTKYCSVDGLVFCEPHYRERFVK